MTTKPDSSSNLPDGSIPPPSNPGNVSADKRSAAAGRDITGTVITGDVGGDVTIVTGEQAYDVRSLANPYLGLSSFTYVERAKYAGREKLIAETVAKITVPAAPIALLFITGASGSGKSSFAQAGLLPALESHYGALAIKRAVFRPGGNPLAALADALWRQLGLPLIDTSNLTPESFGEALRAHTPASQVNVLVVDQFEELFTQSAAPSSDALFNLLAHLPPFITTHTHVIATMRSDYLPELFNHQELYEIAKRGVDLRAMSVDELREAIQQPLRAAYPDDKKRFQPELVERLAQDAAQDAAYLPLLQVTLEEIWRKGSLTLGAYTNLGDAIKQRADQVLQYRDYDSAAPREVRSPADQDALLHILLDLVDVSPGDSALRDVRHQRTKTELAHGDLARAQLIDVLAQARLLSVESEASDASHADVDIIHESLLTNWDRLRGAIAGRRHELHQRARFEQNLDEWLTQNRSADYLLDGVRLAEARELEARDDVAMQGADAKAFLRASVDKAEAERQRELERERQLAASQKQRAQIFRFAAIGLSFLLLVAIGASCFAFQQQTIAGQQRDAAVQANATSQAEANARATAEANAVREKDLAEQQLQINNIRRLAAQSVSLRDTRFDLALVLAVEASHWENKLPVRIPEVRGNLLDTLTSYPQLVTFFRKHDSFVTSVAFSPDGKTLASGSYDGTIILWDVSTHQPLGQPLKGHTSAVISVAFSPDGKTLASGSVDATIILWDVSLDSWQARACYIATRNLTRAEYAQYINSDPTAYDNDYAKNLTCKDFPVESLPTPKPPLPTPKP